MRSLRIVHVLDTNRLHVGSVVQMMEAVRLLAERGHRLIVVSRPGGDLGGPCADAGVTLQELRFAGRFDLPTAAGLRWILRAERPDIVHVHKELPHATALIAATGLGRHPRLVVDRGVSFPLDRLNRWKYRHPRVGAVVCVAEAVRRVVVETGRVRPERVHVIHPGTDTGRFHPDRADGGRVRAELGIGPSDPVIVQVSLRRWKGWQELLAAVASVRVRIPDVRLLLVGEDPRDRFAEVIRSLGLAAPVVRVVPFRQDMPDLLAAADVVVDASWAGTGITGTIREAMALERAVLATSCGGNRELVADGTGVLVPPRDVDALSAALGRLLEDPELRRRLGRSGRRRVAEQFTSERRVDRLEALYRRVASDGPASGRVRGGELLISAQPSPGR